MNDPLHKLDIHYASLDEVTLMAQFKNATLEKDFDSLESLVRQLVLRAVPVVERTVHEFGQPRGLGLSDLRLVEDEALTKLVLRLGRGLPLPSIRVLAYEIARACAEDPERRPTATSKIRQMPRALRSIDGGLSSRVRSNGHRRGPNYG